MINKNLEFITKLDEKLHSTKTARFTANLSMTTHAVNYDYYTQEKMSTEEAKKLLCISKKNNYVILPINTAMGFSVGYELVRFNIFNKNNKKSLLRFKESQLPKEYTFEKMSETFMSKSNLMKARLIGREIVNDYSCYSY